MENITNRVGLKLSGKWLASWALLGCVACGPMEEAPAPTAVPSTRAQELRGENGLVQNGLVQNGLVQNGLTENGLVQNGLTENGLTSLWMASSDFSTWFAQDPELSAMVMKYVVRCAVPEGESRSYLDSSTGTSYTWEGSLGLAPGWASGTPATEAEQQLVSACLAAHVNKFGLHVPLSVLGRTAQQETIPYTSDELQTFSRSEGCFFGNLFTGEGLFAGADGDYLYDDESSPRACALTTQEDASVSQCSPIVHVESCETLCTRDPSGLFYSQCTYNGHTYLPLTTRIRPEDVYSCGDGVCQFTESCGSGTQPNSCLSDCGPCE